MLTHYLLTLYRTLTRHRLYAALNVLGLAVGIAVFLVLGLFVRFETGFDRWLPDADNIYRVTATYSFPGRSAERSAQASSLNLPALQSDYPGVLTGVRVLDQREPVASGTLINNRHVAYVDANFFDILDLPLVAGDRRLALAKPDDVVITEAIANQYFGSTSVLGRSITLYYQGKPRLYRISAVLKDPPADTSLKFELVTPLDQEVMDDPQIGWTLWGIPNSETFVRFRSRADAEAVIADLPHLAKRHASNISDLSKAYSIGLTPLRALHFADLNVEWPMKPGVDVRLVYSLGAVGLLTLAIAILNYVNLATAQSAVRAKEIALRKVLGASRQVLMAQLMLEAWVLTLLAGLFGLAMAELALPAVGVLGGDTLRLSYWGDDGVMPWLLGLTMAIGLVAGAYPALLLSRLQPAPVLSSVRTPGGGRLEARVRAALITAQFVVAIAFMVSALVVSAQAAFLRAEDRGFDRQGMIFVESFQRQEILQQQTAIIDAFRRLPGVVAATASIREVGLPNRGLADVRRRGQSGAGPTIEFDEVRDDYLRAFGAQLVTGRMFDRSRHTDDSSERAADAPGVDASILLNESAVRTLGFSSPAAAIGQQVIVRTFGEPARGAAYAPIIGVLRDIHLGSPQQPVAPVAYRYYGVQNIGSATGVVRYSGVGDAEMMMRLQAAWRRLAPTVPFEAKTAEEGLRQFYVPDEQRARLFAIGSVLAVSIGCLGLYGLAAFSATRRFRETGIRKTLGASTGDVLKLLLAQILQPVLIANLIAWPLAYLAMRSWLASFDQRIALSLSYFVAATLLALVIACLTVVAKTLRLARSEPAKALRYE